MKIVTASYFTGWSMTIFQLVGLGPKFTITCGECGVTFQKRIPMVDSPKIPCTHCHTINELPLTIRNNE